MLKWSHAFLHMKEGFDRGFGSRSRPIYLRISGIVAIATKLSTQKKYLPYPHGQLKWILNPTGLLHHV